MTWIGFEAMGVLESWGCSFMLSQVIESTTDSNIVCEHMTLLGVKRHHENSARSALEFDLGAGHHRDARCAGEHESPKT